MTILSRFLARPAVADRLIARAVRTPDEHLPGYMMRYWLFNPYDRETRRRRWAWIPFSIRIHHILRADHARDHHDHPWDARTVILKGGYVERRLGADGFDVTHCRAPGDTAAINFGEFHTIDQVTPGGAWTFFIMGRYRGVWGFLVGEKKVRWQDYHDGGAA